MDDPMIIRVNLIRGDDTDNVAYFEALNHISRQIDDDAFLHLYRPDTLFVFLRSGFCPRIKPPVYQHAGKVTAGLILFKHGNELSEISGLGHVQLNKQLKNSFNGAVNRMRQVRYDVTGRRFVNMGRFVKIPLSKRIRPVVRVVSLKEEYQRHEQSYSSRRNKNARVQKSESLRGYVTREYDAFHKHETSRTWPLDRFEHDLAATERSPVQATDGPYENVDFHLSNLTSGLALDAPVSSRPRVSCRYPDYADEETRRRSFRNWPLQQDVQDVDELAKYGMFYTGPADLVRCYQCGLGLKDWSRAEDPLLEHVRFSPQCLHLADIVVSQELDQLRTATAAISNAEEDNGDYRCRHPEYRAFAARLGTFRRWPTNLVQTPTQLSEAGFYYTGFQDQVRCYACDGGLQHWDTEDDPWIEHARWFAHCHHVRTVKGMGFIRMVQMALQDLVIEPEVDYVAVDEPVDTRDTTENGAASGGRLESDDPIYYPEAQKVITNFGFSKAAVKMAIEECSAKKTRWNCNILADLLFEKQSRGEALPLDSPRPESPVQPEVDVNTADGVAAENRRLLSRLRCIQCEENDADILFLPCGHHKMCKDCASDVSMCPLCAKTVKQKVKTYML